MSKGSSPRNNHSTQFRDNYDEISWTSRRKSSGELVHDHEIKGDRHPQDSSRESSEVLMGAIRQSTNNPLNKDN